MKILPDAYWTGLFPLVPKPLELPPSRLFSGLVVNLPLFHPWLPVTIIHARVSEFLFLCRLCEVLWLWLSILSVIELVSVRTFELSELSVGVQ